MAKYRDLGIADAGFVAGEDMSASGNRYKFVSLSSSADKVLLATGTSLPKPLGILQNTPCSGEEAAVRIFGFSKLRYNAATCDANIGRGISANASGDGQGVGVTGCDNAAAISMESVTSGSAFIEVLLTPFGVIGESAS